MAEYTTDILVLGGGIAGMETAATLADLDLDVVLLERKEGLGGQAAHWACMATDECARCSACLIEDSISRVLNHNGIRILTHGEVTGLSGSSGNFKVSILPAPGSLSGMHDRRCRIVSENVTINAKATVLATGFEPFDPKNHRLLGYGHLPEVMTTKDLDDFLLKDDLDTMLPEDSAKNKIAFIQCVGSRDRKRGREYCSQFCCKTSIRLVNRLKYLRPDLDITIYYIDLQIMGKEFRTFFEQSKRNVRFLQGVPAEVRPGGELDRVRVVGIDPKTGLGVEEEYNRIVLAVGMAPATRNNALIRKFGLNVNEFGFVESAMEKGVIRTSIPGVYLAGACAGPADIQASRLQAMAAAWRIATNINARRQESAGIAV